MFKRKTLDSFIISSLFLLLSCQDENLEKCKNAINDENKKSLAFSYCEKAAQQGNPEGQTLFAEILIRQKQYDRAIEFLEKSANQLNPQALFRLGELYATGSGVEQDLNKAKFYYRYSCEQKFIKGCERENSLKLKDELQAKQAKAQIAFEQHKKAEQERLENERQKLEQQKQEEKARLEREKQAFEQQKLEDEKRKLAEQRAELEKQKLALAQQVQTEQKQEHKLSTPDPNAFYDGLAKFHENGLWGFIDRNGNVVIRPQFAYAGRFSRGRAAVQSNYSKLWGFIDTKGNYIVYPNYCSVAAFSESDGLAGVYNNGRMHNGQCVGGKWGFIDIHGNWILNPIFDSAWRFIDGKAKVTYNGITGYINRNGQWVD